VVTCPPAVEAVNVPAVAEGVDPTDEYKDELNATPGDDKLELSASVVGESSVVGDEDTTPDETVDSELDVGRELAKLATEEERGVPVLFDVVVTIPAPPVEVIAAPDPPTGVVVPPAPPVEVVVPPDPAPSVVVPSEPPAEVVLSNWAVVVAFGVATIPGVVNCTDRVVVRLPPLPRFVNGVVATIPVVETPPVAPPVVDSPLTVPEDEPPGPSQPAPVVLDAGGLVVAAPLEEVEADGLLGVSVVEEVAIAEADA
jgi:hypothetical protein